MKLTVSKSKISASFYVQKTIRKPNGNVTTITVEKLGKLTEVTAKAGGTDHYVWAQEYVNELNRREYEQNKEVIVSDSPSKLLKKGEQKLFNCAYLFLQGIYYSLRLDEVCKDIASRHAFSYDLNDVLSKLIYIRILCPSPKLSSHREAARLIGSGKYKQRPKNQNNPHRFIYREKITKEGELCSEELVCLDTKAIQGEERYDGFYAVCTNLDDMGDGILQLNKKR